MWHMIIECTALAIVCATNPDPVPIVQREFATQIECDRALIALSERWHPQGAWKMNCVKR